MGGDDEKRERPQPDAPPNPPAPPSRPRREGPGIGPDYDTPRVIDGGGGRRSGMQTLERWVGDIAARAVDASKIYGSGEAEVRALNDARIKVAVVTNQRAVALGLLDDARLAAIHRELEHQLREQAGAHVDAIHVCPHAAGECACRKPLPGLLEDAAAAFGIAPERSVMIGDAASDVEAGRRFGARTVQLTTGRSAADATAPDLLDAVRALLGPQ